MSIPEPPPKPCGIVVPDTLIAYMKDCSDWKDLCNLVEQRDAFGRKKYGQPLMSEDGRNGVEDARQEAGDLLQYAFKVYLANDKQGLKELSILISRVEDVINSLLNK